MIVLKIGDKAPDFKVEDHQGVFHQLSDYLGKKVVLFFYPKASTPGCTMEVCNLRDHFDSFDSSNYSLLGVSADTKEKQAKFVEKHQLPFPLLADVNKELIEAYGVWGPKKFMGRVFDGIHRKTFVIDEKGFIETIIEKVKTKDHASQIL